MMSSACGIEVRGSTANTRRILTILFLRYCHCKMLPVRYRHIVIKKFLSAVYVGLSLVFCSVFLKNYSRGAISDEGEYLTVPRGARFTEELNGDATRDDDPRLLQEIRSKFLLQPTDLPYSSDVKWNSSDVQIRLVDKLLNKKRGGVFVEAGANNGIHLSNTLFFELHRGWTGLLVEPIHGNFEELQATHRQAVMCNSCLSITSHPEKVPLDNNNSKSKIITDESLTVGEVLSADVKMVQCFPLHSLLLAANITTVDFFSLDVEGQDFNVLKTIPWDRVDIKVIFVEHKHVPEGKDAVVQYMAARGYNVFMETVDGFDVPSDVLLVRKDIAKPTEVVKAKLYSLTSGGKVNYVMSRLL